MGKIKFLFWINAIFFILFGFLLFIAPDVALRTIIIVFSIEAILSGIAGAVFLLQEKEVEDKGLLAGVVIVQILLGVLLLFFPRFGETLLKIFVVMLGISAVIKGILLSINSFSAKELGVKEWGWILAAGIVLSLIGLFLIFNSFLSILVLNSLIGLGMIFSGIAMIIWAFQLNKTKKIIKKEINETLENGGSIEIEITEIHEE